MYDPFGMPDPRPVEPGEFPAWDEALALVNRDLATLLPEQGPLRLMALPSWEDEESQDEHVYVALSDGRWHGNDLPPGSDATPAAALAAVAEAAQDTVLECLWQVWPECTEHRLGMHPSRGAEGGDESGGEGGLPVWRCAGGRDARNPEHVRAIGELDPPYRPRRVRRKERKRRKAL
ncbi:hypothetical protein OG562_33310 [Streptomyces sp. NBC_01275]|uniref:hypothetical protein n=1 Tax=Streptomyces sp. NBC_01275 TaxID=2903807 RepID=UPI002251F050|nr:hypothetical protein [Streptomyces sp. NBC_01275]MCX4765771.1 hypothetical protein [Streptomyces sp. NBC_01275]